MIYGVQNIWNDIWNYAEKDHLSSVKKKKKNPG